MKLPKLKVDTPVEVTFVDIHSASAGWQTNSDTLEVAPITCTAVGYCMGITKHKEMAIASLKCDVDNTNGTRIFIPIGTITKIRKFR